MDADWTGGIYISPAVAGSRPGALIVGAWATMMRMGRKGSISDEERSIDRCVGFCHHLACN